MKAIILAAGRGSRLGALTQNRPKPLTPLLGKPLIEWQLQSLKQAGVKDISLITGYQSDMMKSYGNEQIFNPRWNNSNMVRSLICAGKLLETETCIISYGDITFKPEHVHALVKSTGNLAITYDTDWRSLWSARFSDPLSDAESFQVAGSRLIDIGRKPSCMDEVQGQYMGLLKFTPAGWKAMTDWLGTLGDEFLDRLDMTTLLRHLLDSGIEIETVPVTGGWVEIDNPSDIILYESNVADGTWHHDWR